MKPLLTIILLSASALIAQAQSSITVAWDHPLTNNVSFKVYQGTNSVPLVLTSAKQVTLTPWDFTSTKTLTVTATDTLTGLESVKSAPLVTPVLGAAPTGLRVIGFTQ